MNEDKYSSIIKSNFSLRNYSLTKEKLIEQNQSLKIKIRKTNLFNKMMEKRLSQFDLTKATNYSLEDIVLIGPDDIELTLIPIGPISLAKYLTLASNAALAAPIRLYPGITLLAP